MLQLHMWHYNGSGEESTPVVVLKTKRSLRAVHFHPHGAPFLMTAEVIDHFYLILGFLLNCLSAYIFSELVWLAGEWNRSVRFINVYSNICGSLEVSSSPCYRFHSPGKQSRPSSCANSTNCWKEPIRSPWA